MLDVCEMLMLTLSLSNDESNFGKSFFPHLSLVRPHSGSPATIFFFRFNVADDTEFFIFKLN